MSDIENQLSESQSEEWQSAFSVNSTKDVTGSSSYQTVFVYDGVYYWIIHARDGRTDDSYNNISISVPFSSLYYYDPDTALWVDTGENTDYPFMNDSGYHIQKSWLIAESWNDDVLSSYYYSRDSFDNRFIPAPVGSVFDGIYLSSPLEGVLLLLPVLLSCAVLFVGIRKGIGFVREKLARS